VKGAAIALGILAALGGFGYSGLWLGVNSMAKADGGGEDIPPHVFVSGLVGVVGIGAIILAEVLL
jgi:hypothetical protein